MLANRETAEKAWHTESEVLKACSAGHEDLAEPWRLPRLITSIAERGLCCNVIEYIEGEGLDERLKRGKLSEDEAWKLLLEGMRCLEALHGQGFAHRDVRPANLVVRQDGGVTLIDVNTAHEAGRTSFTALKEQDWHVIPPDAGWRDTPRDADVYALGAIVMGGLLGRAPCELLRREPPYGYLDLELLEGANNISGRLKAALRRVCAMQPEQRPDAAAGEISKLEGSTAEEKRELAPLLPASLTDALAQVASATVKRRPLPYSVRCRHTSHDLPLCMGGGREPHGVDLDYELLNRARELDHAAVREEVKSKLEMFSQVLSIESGEVSVRLRWFREPEGGAYGDTWSVTEELKLCMTPPASNPPRWSLENFLKWWGKKNDEVVLVKLSRSIGWVEKKEWGRWQRATPDDRGDLIWYEGNHSALKYRLTAYSQKVFDLLQGTAEGAALQKHLSEVTLKGAFTIGRR
jgi:serine/threonine protein kinase